MNDALFTRTSEPYRARHETSRMEDPRGFPKSFRSAWKSSSVRLKVAEYRMNEKWRSGQRSTLRTQWTQQKRFPKISDGRISGILPTRRTLQRRITSCPVLFRTFPSEFPLAMIWNIEAVRKIGFAWKPSELFERGFQKSPGQVAVNNFKGHTAN